MKTWARPSDVDPESGIAEQLSLMTTLAAGNISAADFARRWYAARRRSLDSNERVREPFQRLLDQIFYNLEDYAIDPEQHEDGDLTDDELTENVSEVLRRVCEL